MEKIIFHIDVNNAFLSWTAVLLLKQGYKTDIRTIPSIIAGDEKERRGVVLAKSPIAKKYGIVTAETIYQAKKKCPDIQIFKGDYDWYHKQSELFINYLKKYSPTIEQYSIDECFIDMTGTNYLYKDYVELANKIKDDIKQLYGFTVNVGIANNKLCAKMASDFEKPDKVHTLFKDEIVTKLWPLDVKELFMVGKKTAEQLHEMNIYTIEQLAHTNEKKLEVKFKKQAKYLKDAAWGIDNTEVSQTQRHKNNSISTTMTLPFDVNNKDKLKDYLLMQTEKVCRELRDKNKFAKTVAIIFKSKNFITSTSQTKLDNASCDTRIIYKKVLEIFDENYNEEEIRLIGVRLSDLVNEKREQVSIFDNQSTTSSVDEFQKTLDKINKKFGDNLIIPASLKVLGDRDK